MEWMGKEREEVLGFTDNQIRVLHFRNVLLELFCASTYLRFPADKKDVNNAFVRINQCIVCYGTVWYSMLWYSMV